MSSAEFVLFSDFHAHNHNYKAKWVEFEGKTLNSRLVSSILTLRQIRKYCVDNRVYHVLFCGDLFHTREAVKTAVFNMIVAELVAFGTDDIRLTMIPGNHDMADRDGVHHSLEALRAYDHITVVDGGDVDRVTDATLTSYSQQVEVFAVPYTEDKEVAMARINKVADIARKRPKFFHPAILIAHQGIQGADLGADYIQMDDHDLSINELPLDAFTCCWFGHFHKHQPLAQNAWYVGATEPHNWGDAGQRRGFIHLTIDTSTLADDDEERKFSFKFIESESPRFIHYKAADAVNVKPRPGDFVKVHTAEEETEELKKSYEAVLGTSVELVAVKKAEEAAFVLEEDQLHAHGLVDAWVDRVSLSDYVKDRLKRIGKKLLAAAESKGL